MTVEQQRKTKVGDRIKITKEHDGRHVGEVGTVVEVSISAIFVDLKDEKHFKMEMNKSYDDWELAQKTLATLQQGDTILDDDDDEVKVLGVIRPGLYVLSENYDHDQVDAIYTAEYLEESGYKFKETTAEPVKLTVSEAAKLLGIETLEIVKG